MFFFLATCFEPRYGDFNLCMSNTGQVFANTSFKKHELVLLPFGQVQVIDKEKVTANTCVISLHGRTEVFAVSPSKPDWKKPGGLFVPYFLVKEALIDPAAAILERTTVKYGEPVCTIPAYRNKKALEKGTELLLEAAGPAKKKAKKR